jgi:hypothetical protein
MEGMSNLLSYNDVVGNSSAKQVKAQTEMIKLKK